MRVGELGVIWLQCVHLESSLWRPLSGSYTLYILCVDLIHTYSQFGSEAPANLIWVCPVRHFCSKIVVKQTGFRKSEFEAVNLNNIVIIFLFCGPIPPK